VLGAHCPACHSLLTPGARFCHRCGLAVGSLATAAAAVSGAGTAPAVATEPGLPSAAPAGAPAQRPSGSLLPWGVAALAFIAVVAILAGQRFGANGSPGAAPDDQDRVPLGGGGAARAPDISSLSPRERADRLFDRMMRLESEGKKDSIAFFAPMALSAYQAIGTLDADLRYDMGRVAEISGNAEVAAAQADTILRQNPTHLLGLVLAGRAAALRGDTRAQQEFARRLVAAEPAESQKALEEYGRHRGDIDDALARARR
jgi:hypothetical protein